MSGTDKSLGDNNLIDKLLPKDSLRRYHAENIYDLFVHPKTTLGALGLIKGKTKGLDASCRRLMYLRACAESAMINVGGSFALNTDDNPVVSIIIPAYEHFDETYRCLRAIEVTVKDIPFEVIVADDCSKLATSQISRYIKGVRHIRTDGNQGFLKNCNNAAGYAKGKYIVFLNNDTEPMEGWLSYLVELMDNNPEIGMTGSKLIYSDGTVQEAGGIVWSDGSGWNYGKGSKPYFAAEYSYVKEVDYISGAAIMIRSGLFREIGGFDERFAPAYYEDTDLAFEVRKHGYKVVLQPKSVVIHHEGVSNGTDTSSGIKKYQDINKPKFIKKWQDVLQAEQIACDEGQNVFIARDRSQHKKRLLMFDHHVPFIDQDAGSRHTFMYIKMLLKLGYKITFVTDDYLETQPYSEILNTLGVEVLYGDYYCKNIEDWLKNNLKYYDIVYLQRPHVSIKYIDVIKDNFAGKIVYFAHDLHNVRLMREYEITGDINTRDEALKWKEIEHDLFDKADIGYVVGSFEQEIVAKQFPDKIIRNIPLYIYEQTKSVSETFVNRKDILFVGGFVHKPNLDAVLWFAREIFPKIKAAIPDIKWHIVGAKAPAEVEALAGNDIIVEGFVSDERLSELYDTCKVAVVPLRFGAGVKGKILEACCNAIPVVTTPIGAEGLDLSMEPMIVAEGAEQIAKEVINIYNDDDVLKLMAQRGCEFILKNYSPTAAIGILKESL